MTKAELERALADYRELTSRLNKKVDDLQDSIAEHVAAYNERGIELMTVKHEAEKKIAHWQRYGWQMSRMAQLWRDRFIGECEMNIEEQSEGWTP